MPTTDDIATSRPSYQVGLARPSGQRPGAFLLSQRGAGRPSPIPPRPTRPPTPTQPGEKVVLSAEGTSNFIDLYKRGVFCAETKQGVDARW